MGKLFLTLKLCIFYFKVIEAASYGKDANETTFSLSTFCIKICNRSWNTYGWRDWLYPKEDFWAEASVEFPVHLKDRSSHPEVFLGKGVRQMCSKFTEEHRCRTPFPKNTSEWLLLKRTKKPNLVFLRNLYQK